MAKTVTKKLTEKTNNEVTPEQRYRMIAEAAFYLAENRGFEPGHHDKDWEEAEAQVNATLD